MRYLSPAAAALRETHRRPDGRFGPQAHRPPEAPPTARGLTGFSGALQALDEELVRQGFEEQVRIRAIGGYALLHHGLREQHAYTVDIDSLTDAYPAPVRAAINRVGDALGLEPDWLNTDAAGDDTAIALEILDAEFITQDVGFERIDLRVADIPTLTRAKAVAVDTDELSGRQRDWPDLLELLRVQGIRDYASFCRTYPTIQGWEYPETHRSLEAWFRTGDRGTPVDDPGDFSFGDDYWG